jgi:hypothetical protein
MRTTRSPGTVPPYLGVDLTDRYSRQCRASDVCGLAPTRRGKLEATFWTWEWDRAPKRLDVGTIVEELAEAECALLDGPQGLARTGETIRACERAAAAVGKTPDKRPCTGPYRGFVESALDLFHALQGKVPISPVGEMRGVGEAYPGHGWRALAGRPIPKKKTDEGRAIRRRILETLGVTWSVPAEMLNDDHLDACYAAVVAAAACGKIAGLTTTRLGLELTCERRVLREGPIVVPVVSATLRARLAARV